MQNIDAETGLQSKKEPSHYFSSHKATRRDSEITNPTNGDHHFVFGNDSPRLPLEVYELKKYFMKFLVGKQSYYKVFAWYAVIF